MHSSSALTAPTCSALNVISTRKAKKKWAFFTSIISFGHESRGWGIVYRTLTSNEWNLCYKPDNRLCLASYNSLLSSIICILKSFCWITSVNQCRLNCIVLAFDCCSWKPNNIESLTLWSENLLQFHHKFESTECHYWKKISRFSSSLY